MFLSGHRKGRVHTHHCGVRISMAKVKQGSTLKHMTGSLDVILFHNKTSILIGYTTLSMSQTAHSACSLQRDSIADIPGSCIVHVQSVHMYI